MPVISMDSGPLSYEQKERLIKELTKTASGIMGFPESAYVVILNEMNRDNIGVGGEMVSKPKK